MSAKFLVQAGKAKMPTTQKKMFDGKMTNLLVRILRDIF